MSESNHKKHLSEEQIEKFRSVLNRSISALCPDHDPSTPLEFSNHDLRLIAGILGTEGTGREVETYVKLENEKWKDDPVRGEFLKKLLAVVEREIELLEFFNEGELQKTHPMPDRVHVVDLDSGSSEKTIKFEDFLEEVKSISDSSVFKK
jgi:hypothetical protein